MPLQIKLYINYANLLRHQTLFKLCKRPNGFIVSLGQKSLTFLRQWWHIRALAQAGHARQVTRYVSCHNELMNTHPTGYRQNLREDSGIASENNSTAVNLRFSFTNLKQTERCNYNSQIHSLPEALLHQAHRPICFSRNNSPEVLVCARMDCSNRSTKMHIGVSNPTEHWATSRRVHIRLNWALSHTVIFALVDRIAWTPKK